VNRWESFALWIALFIAFAPVVVNLGANLAVSPAAYPTLIAPLLIAFCVARGIRRGVSRRSSGIVLLFMSVALEFVGLVGSAWSIARFGLPIAILGIARWTGMMSLAVAALAFWMIPIPDFVFNLTTPTLESALLKAAATVAQVIGIHVNAVGPVASTAAHHLEMQPHDTGIRIAFVLSEFGWFAAVLRGARPIQLAANAGCFALLAIPVQFFAVLIALALLSAGWPSAADAWLLHGSWLTAALGSGIYLWARNPVGADPRRSGAH
jgi:hypothetical protein